MTEPQTTDPGTEPEAPQAATSADDLEERLVAEGEIAGDYREELLDLLDFDGDIDLDVEGDRAVVSIDGGGDLNKLVGRKGEVLDALQELTRLAVHQKTGERSRLMLRPGPPLDHRRNARQIRSLQRVQYAENIQIRVRFVKISPCRGAVQDYGFQIILGRFMQPFD